MDRALTNVQSPSSNIIEFNYFPSVNDNQFICDIVAAFHFTTILWYIWYFFYIK